MSGKVLDQHDAVAAASLHHKVLLENEKVRVIETLIRPGEETGVHTHVWGGHLYIISWSACTRFDEKGNVMMESTVESGPIPGSVIPAAPLPLHSLRNTGTQNIHVILTELKD